VMDCYDDSQRAETKEACESPAQGYPR
jgi:hypothetical protein